MFKIKKNLFRCFILLMICFTIIKALNKITNLKIGLENQEIIVFENQTIYEIKTNYLHLKITINNFENIKISQIADKIISDSPSAQKCSYSCDFCQSKLYIIFHLIYIFFIFS